MAGKMGGRGLFTYAFSYHFNYKHVIIVPVSNNRKEEEADWDMN